MTEVIFATETFRQIHQQKNVLTTVATAKDKTTAKDNTRAGDELLKMVKQKRVCNITNN